MKWRKVIAIALLILWSALGSIFLLQKVGVFDNDTNASGAPLQKMWACFVKIVEEKSRLNVETTPSAAPLLVQAPVSIVASQIDLQEGSISQLSLSPAFQIPLRV